MSARGHHPADDAIDELARSIPALRPDAVRVERMRSELLASAGGVTPLPTRTFGPRTLGVAAVAVALAAAVAMWFFVGRGHEASAGLSSATLEPAADAVLARIGAPPDEIVQLRQGSLTIEVARLGVGQRFRVITSDAEVEVRGTRFVVAADQGRLVAVAVERGVVELRLRSGTVVMLEAGQRWPDGEPAKTARVDDPQPLPLPQPQPQPQAQPQPQPQLEPQAPAQPLARPPVTRRSGADGRVDAAKEAPVAPPAPPAPASAPGEAEFRDGWDAMRRGDADRAAASFAASHRAAKRGAVAEDARYWEGVALARAGRSTDAIAALGGFLSSFPRSSRAGEAAARLGWLQIDAGHVDDAERRFEAAVDDAVPAVRKSARAGLARVAAIRAAAKAE